MWDLILPDGVTQFLDVIYECSLRWLKIFEFFRIICWKLIKFFWFSNSINIIWWTVLSCLHLFPHCRFILQHISLKLYSWNNQTLRSALIPILSFYVNRFKWWANCLISWLGSIDSFINQKMIGKSKFKLEWLSAFCA